MKTVQRRQHAIERRRRAATLDVTERGRAGIETGALVDLNGELVRDAAESDRIGRGLDPLRDDLVPALLRSAFAHAHDGEALVLPAARLEHLADLVEVVGDFRNEDDVAAAGDAGVQ